MYDLGKRHKNSGVLNTMVLSTASQAMNHRTLKSKFGDASPLQSLEHCPFKAIW